MAKSSHKVLRQYGAIPFAVDESGRVRVALLTSRETHRWVIPKGWPIADLSGMDVASREAREEAGLIGTITDAKPAGTYRYKKRLTSGKVADCQVMVYLLRVQHELDVWPERDERVRAWFSPQMAARLVAEKALAAILAGITMASLPPGSTDPEP